MDWQTGRRTPKQRLTEEQREAMLTIKQIAAELNIERNTLAGCIGLANWQSFETNPNKGRRALNLANLLRTVKRAKISAR